MPKRKSRSPLQMISPSFSRLEILVLIKPALIDLELIPAARSQKEGRLSGSEEVFKRMETSTEPESETRIRLESPRSAQDV